MVISAKTAKLPKFVIITAVTDDSDPRARKMYVLGSKETVPSEEEKDLSDFRPTANGPDGLCKSLQVDNHNYLVVNPGDFRSWGEFPSIVDDEFRAHLLAEERRAVEHAKSERAEWIQEAMRQYDEQNPLGD